MNANSTVIVVDDDRAVRESLSMMLEQKGFAVSTFDSAEAFLADCQTTSRSCAIVDIRMPGMDGLALQGELAKLGNPIPIVFLTGHGEIPISVRAMKMGAVDFLPKPITCSALLESVAAALLESDKRRELLKAKTTAAAHLGSLTGREREVAELTVAGLSSKEIGRRLDISHRTVEIHRARIMKKTGADQLIDLMHLIETAKADF